LHDTLIRNGTVVTEHGVEELDVAIEHETIVALLPRDGEPPEAREVIDATGRLVLPGGIDPHVHYEVVSSHGTVVSESADNSIAAAVGGNTTVIDFAFHEEQPTTHAAVDERMEKLNGRMAVDFGLHIILTGAPSFEVLEEIPDLVRMGFPSFKTFTTYRWIMDDGYRFGVMRAVAEAGGMSVIHAEDDALIGWLTKKYQREGKTHGAYISETRNALVEEAAVRRAVLLAERAGSPLYVLHVGAGDAADAIGDARRRGVPCFGEALIGNLSFTQDNLWDRSPIEIDGQTFPDRGLIYNNYQDLKTAEDRERLWQALESGSLQAVSSDHFLAKAIDRYTHMGTTIPGVMSGQAAVELRIPVLYTLGVASGRFDLPAFVRLISTNPARIGGLYPRKGTLAPGSDADVLIFDPEARWNVVVDELAMDTDYSCWEGWELQGRVDTVLLRGTVLVRDGAAVPQPPRGRFLERAIEPDLLPA
jgi:dihydropyrimidinase